MTIVTHIKIKIKENNDHGVNSGTFSDLLGESYAGNKEYDKTEIFITRCFKFL